MGDFRMTIEAAGGHGCDRLAEQGDDVHGCHLQTCPDCMFATFVSALQRAGMRPAVATFHHWPADMAGRGYTPEREVIDDYTEREMKHPTGAFTYATGRRVKGAF